jgi:hypothetical protein
MPSKSEISARLAFEAHRRGRLSVPAFAGGVLYLLGGIVSSSALKGLPTVGVIQGVEPAIAGQADPLVSPRAAEVKFISHKAFPLLTGSLMTALSITALTLVLLFFLDATRFRRPGTWPAARPLLLVGGFGLAIFSFLHQIISAIETHNFAKGHDFTIHAVNNALTTGALNVSTGYIDLLVGLAFVVAIIVTMVNVIRVGLLPRWVGIVGMLVGVLIFLPIGGETLDVITAFWLAALGLLNAGRWPNGDLPAWTSGEARPWPSQAQARAARRGEAIGQPALAGAEISPAPNMPGGNGSSRKRRRKRGTRG